QREAVMSRVRRDDPALAFDVEALLAREAEVETSHFLEGTAWSAEPTLAGQTIGSYTLDRALGQGGMGSVWLAHRSDGRFEGRVAFKFLSLALMGRGGAERFAREGDVLARLVHPNIARLLDAGIAPSGQPYLVLEYVDGEPIDRWCDEHKAGLEPRIRLFLQVLAAVEFAHRNLILHRDLKPGNILVTADGTVKLLDFGIAKLLSDGGQAQGTELTALAGRAFTPEYAAPEQVQGGNVTTSTDVYALGVLLYRLLSGTHPTASEKSTPVERLRGVVEVEPLRLSRAIARASDKNAAIAGLTSKRLQGDLDNIAAKALRKNPRERYPTVAAFADDLERYLAHEPISARPDSGAYRLGKFVRRHRVAVGAVTVTVLALVAGVIGTTWQAIEARRERDQALFQAERAGANANLINLLIGTLGSDTRPLTPIEILERSAALVDQHYSNDSRLAIALLMPIAGQYKTLGDTSREYAVMKRAAEHAQSSGDPSLLAKVACNTVETELARGQLDAARAELRRGRESLTRVERPSAMQRIECLHAAADVAKHVEDFDQAIAFSREALAIEEREGDTRGVNYTKLLSFLSAVQQQSGDLAGSYATLRKILDIDEKLQRADSLSSFVERRNEAMLLIAFGEYREARAIVEEVSRRWTSVTGDALLPFYLAYTRGLVMHRFGELESARREFEAASVELKAKGSLNFEQPVEIGLARVLIELGRVDEAEARLASVDAAARTPSRSTVASLGIAHAEKALAGNDAARAVQLIESDLRTMGFPEGRDTPQRSTALRVAVRAHLAAGDTSQAQQRAGQALSAAQRLARDPAKSAHVGEALLMLARTQRAGGDHASAQQTAHRSAETLASTLGDDHALTQEARMLAALAKASSTSR
ncbi:MAG TPA: protein kinase, partial [Casimicrobiaceae bacterium]|nr:protein kinase [Casimicrobiaceae bacterium]